MNIILWLLQIILGIKMITVSYSHGLRQSQPTIQAAIHKLGGFSRPVLYIAAALTFIGTLGLILPGLMGLPTWITPLSAAFLGLLLLISIFFHLKSREKPKIFVSAVLFIFAILIAYGRWFLLPG